MIGAYRASILIVCAGALWLALSALANEPKRVYFYYPRAYVADTEVVIYRVRVPINGENRILYVTAHEGEFEVQRSKFFVDERQSFYDAKFRLPAGEVYLLAALFSSDREIARDTWKVTVYSRISRWHSVGTFARFSVGTWGDESARFRRISVKTAEIGAGGS